MADPTFTRCPGCATVFRVTPEQLALREGQVRCGHCRAVFDANSHLVSVDIRPHEDEEADELLQGRPTVTLRDSHALQSVAPAGSTSPPGAARHEDGGTQPAVEGVASTAEESVRDLERTSSDAERAAPDAESAMPDSVEAVPDAESAAPDSAEAVPDSAEAAPEAEGTAPDADAGEQVAPGGGSASPVDAEELEAARAALRRRAPRPRSGNAFYVFAMLTLIAGLGVQVLLEFHDSLAARIPGLTPVLASACRWLSCSIGPPRDASSLSIEGSDLQADPAHQGLLILTATVRNRSAYALAYPYLELTLTDASDQVVVRRAFAPSEYLGSSAARDAGIAGDREQLVRLFIDASTTRQAGYRLYLFYP